MTEDQAEQLAGNVGGALRIGDTVRRATGPWTPAVHALLGHVAGRVAHVPRVHGIDELSREVLDFMPGRVVDVNVEELTPHQVLAIVRWTRTFHEAVAGFRHPGPWRYPVLPGPTLIGHNDIAPYNVCFAGEELASVFDWDLSGPTTPLWELAFIAWNCVPLWRDDGPDTAARRLRLIAAGYGGPDALQIVRAVPERIRRLLDGIAPAAAAGDPGMANLLAAGEPQRSSPYLAGLVDRIPAIEACLR